MGVVEPPDGIIAASQVGRWLPGWRVAFAFPLDEILPSAVVRFAVIQDFLEPPFHDLVAVVGTRDCPPTICPDILLGSLLARDAAPRYGLTLETWNVLKMFILAGSLSVTACDDAFITRNGPPNRPASTAGAIVNIIGHPGNILLRGEGKPVYRLAFILMPIFRGTAWTM